MELSFDMRHTKCLIPSWNIGLLQKRVFKVLFFIILYVWYVRYVIGPKTRVPKWRLRNKSLCFHFKFTLVFKKICEILIISSNDAILSQINLIIIRFFFSMNFVTIEHFEIFGRRNSFFFSHFSSEFAFKRMAKWDNNIKHNKPVISNNTAFR